MGWFKKNWLENTSKILTIYLTMLYLRFYIPLYINYDYYRKYHEDELRSFINSVLGSQFNVECYEDFVITFFEITEHENINKIGDFRRNTLEDIEYHYYDYFRKAYYDLLLNCGINNIDPHLNKLLKIFLRNIKEGLYHREIIKTKAGTIFAPIPSQVICSSIQDDRILSAIEKYKIMIRYIVPAPVFDYFIGEEVKTMRSEEQVRVKTISEVELRAINFELIEFVEKINFKALAEIMDRIDNSLCNLSRDDPRFDVFLSLSREICKYLKNKVGLDVGSEGIWWKRFTQFNIKTDEEKIRHNISVMQEKIKEIHDKELRQIIESSLEKLR